MEQIQLLWNYPAGLGLQPRPVLSDLEQDRAGGV